MNYKLSKSDWEKIGQRTGWLKGAQTQQKKLVPYKKEKSSYFDSNILSKVLKQKITDAMVKQRMSDYPKIHEEDYETMASLNSGRGEVNHHHEGFKDERDRIDEDSQITQWFDTVIKAETEKFEYRIDIHNNCPYSTVVADFHIIMDSSSYTQYGATADTSDGRFFSKILEYFPNIRVQVEPKQNAQEDMSNKPKPKTEKPKKKPGFFGKLFGRFSEEQYGWVKTASGSWVVRKKS